MARVYGNKSSFFTSHSDQLLFETTDKEQVSFTVKKLLERLEFYNICLHRDEEDEEQYLKYRAHNDNLVIEVEIH